MDPLVILGVVIGLVVGFILGVFSRSGRLNELEEQVRRVQSAADGAKRDVANAQSELVVKQSHINTLNANIGILEEKLKRAEQGTSEANTLVAKLQEDVRAATLDHPALEAELRQRDAALADLGARVESLRSERDAALAQLDETHHLQLDAEKRLAGLAAATIFSVQDEGNSGAGAGSDDGDNSDAATLARITSDEALSGDGAQQDANSLRDALATLAFTGADLARALEKRNKEYDELLARYNALNALSAQPSTPASATSSATLTAIAIPADVSEAELPAISIDANTAAVAGETLSEAASDVDVVAAAVSEDVGTDVEMDAATDVHLPDIGAEMELEAPAGAAERIAALVDGGETVDVVSDGEVDAEISDVGTIEAVEEALELREIEEAASDIPKAQSSEAEDLDVRASLAAEPVAVEVRPSESQSDLETAAMTFGAPVVAPLVDVDAIQADLQTALAAKSDLTAQLQQRDSELYDVTAQLAAVKDELNSAQASREDLNTQLMALEARLDAAEALRAQKEEVENALASKTTEINTLTSVAASAADALKKKETALADANAQLGAANVRIGALIQELDALKHSANSGNVAAQVGVVGAIGTLAAGSAAANENVELDAARARIADLEARLRDAGASGVVGEMSLAAPVVDLSGELKVKQDALAEADARIAGLKNVLHAQLLDSNDAQVRLTVAKNAGIELDDLRARFTDLDAQHRLAISNTNDLQTQLRAQTSYVELLQTEIARMREERDSASASSADEIASLTASVATHMALSQQKQDAIGDADMRLAGLHTQLDELSLVNTRLTSAQTQLNDLGAAKSALEVALQEKETSLTDLSSRLAALQADLNALTSQKATLDTDLANRNAEFDALNLKLGDVRAQLDATLADRDKLRGDIAARDIQLNDLNAELQRVKSEGETALTAKLNEIGTLTAAGVAATAILKERDDALAVANQRIAALEADLNAFESTKASLEARLGEHDLNVQGLTAQLGSLTGERDTAQARIADLEAQLHAKLTELDDQTSRFSLLEHSQVELGNTKAQLEARIGELETQLAGAGAEKIALETRLGEHDLNVQGLTAQLGSLTGERDTAQARIADLEAQLHAKLTELDDQTSRFSLLEHSQVELGNTKAQLEARIGELETQLAGLSSEKASLEARLGEHDLNVQGLNARINVLTDERDAALLRIEALQSSVNATAGDVEALREEVTSIAAERDTALAQLKALEADVSARASEVSVLNDDMLALRDQLAAVMSERDSAHAQVKSLEAEIDLDKLGELNGQINQLQNRLASLTAEREERLSVIRALESDLATTRAQLAAANVPPEPADTLAEDSDIGAMSLVSGNLTKSSAAKSAGDKAKLVACPQHLQEVKGIGSVFEQRLYAAGVGTFWELAHMKDDEMTRVLELNERQKLRMDLDAIRKDAARLAKETDSVGRIWEGKEPDNFEPLEGIGRVYEKKLYDAGICTFAALADTSIEELMRICPPSKIRKPDYEEWIAQARKLARKAKG